MESHIQIEEVFIYTDESKVLGEIVAVSAIINGVQHCTGDIRDQRLKINIQAVFSRITVDPIAFKSLQQCVEYKIYNKKQVTCKEVIEDIYIYATLNL